MDVFLRYPCKGFSLDTLNKIILNVIWIKIFNLYKYLTYSIQINNIKIDK